MSLILEALKKSEAERRLGQAPGLMDGPARPLRRRRRWRLPLAVLAMLAVAAASYWLGQRDGDPAAPLAMREATPGEPASAASEHHEDVSEEAMDPPLPEQTLSPPPAAAPPAVRLPSDPGFRSVERESVPQQAQPLPAPSPPAGPASAPAAPPAPIASNSDIAPAAATLPPAPAAPALPTLAQLSAAQREGLPPLRTSMHVFTDDPATRVVIIDGRRLREGEAVASGLVLQAIEREGSVLDYRGLRFRLPRP